MLNTFIMVKWNDLVVTNKHISFLKRIDTRIDYFGRSHCLVKIDSALQDANCNKIIKCVVTLRLQVHSSVVINVGDLKYVWQFFFSYEVSKRKSQTGFMGEWSR